MPSACRAFTRPCLSVLLLCVGLLPLTSVHAWDASGHRLTAYIAWEFMTPRQRQNTMDILRNHPRFEQDFIGQMPDFIRQADEQEQQRWLLGQAAYWPDIARGLSRADQQRFNRPHWHWTDGAWVRGEATMHGDVHINTDPRPSVFGPQARAVQNESQVDNVVTALEYSLMRLEAPDTDDAARALALCWVLHLLGDLHQPLHTGGALSSTLFPDGDRGGNTIRIRGSSNLHAVWDQALRNLPFQRTLDELIEQARDIQRNNLYPLTLDTDLWLQESRQWLHEAVYTDPIRSAISAADASGDPLPPLTLDEDYVNRMQYVSRQRIALSGLRLARLLN